MVKVAVEYIEIHRKDSSDLDIARALKEQGFSDELLTRAFREAGPRPPGSAEPAKLPLGRRVIVGILFSISAMALVASAVLFVRNFREASAAAAARGAR
jgi:hypothetical protein